MRSNNFYHFLQKDLIKSAVYVRINLYLRALHPLATTGLLPFLLLVILNLKVVRGIKVLTRKSTRRCPITEATSFTTEDMIKMNQNNGMFFEYLHAFLTDV